MSFKEYNTIYSVIYFTCISCSQFRFFKDIPIFRDIPVKKSSLPLVLTTFPIIRFTFTNFLLKQEVKDAIGNMKR